MKMLKLKKGVTLVEVLLAIAIFSVIVFPMFSVFVQSIVVNKKADDLVSANYFSQDYLEQLDSKTYSEALGENDFAYEDYKLTATITPYGNLSSKFSGEDISYIHLIIFEDESGVEKALCVMPDGKWHMFKNDVPSTFSVSISYDSYTFTGGFTSLTGASKYNKCVLIVNAMRKPEGLTSSITLGTNCKAALYCTKLCSEDITFNGGESYTYADIISGDTSLIYVNTAVYFNEKKIATSGAYINIKNWNN